MARTHSKAEASAKIILGGGSVNNLFRQVALAGDVFNSDLKFASRPFFLFGFIDGSSRIAGNIALNYKRKRFTPRKAVRRPCAATA
jgi:hypothetical protein